MEEKKLGVIELTSRKIRLLVGYELENKVYVLYTMEKYIPHLIENGHVLDPIALGKEVKEMTKIYDVQAKLNINVNEALLVLPPCGLEVFETSQMSGSTNEKGIISNYDISNLYTLIKNCDIPHGNKLINIVPLSFSLDGGRIFKRPPCNEESRTITIKAHVHTLPPSLCNGYYQAMEEAGIKINHTFVSPYAASELINTYKDIPENYLLVDIGSDMTSVSVISNHLLYSSTTFNKGGGNITDRIANEFNISVYDAEKYKILYGIDNRVMNFKAPVCESTSLNGENVKHYADELNNIIRSELDDFIKSLNGAIDFLFANQSNKEKRLPLYLIGGGSQLNGLVKYLKPKVESDIVKTLNPTSLGARDPSYFNCLGALYAAKDIFTSVETNKAKIDHIQREEK